MDYQAEYQKKRTTAAEAVKIIQSGDWVDYGWCTNHPVALDRALAARKDELTDVNVRGGVTMWMPEICKADDAGEHFTWNAWHMSGVDRKIAAKGMGYFCPMRYSELPRFYRENVTVDVAMIQVSPMDEHGNFNYGLAASHLSDMLSVAKHIIVEVNQNMPWVNGLTGSEINIMDVDKIVEGDNPPVAELGTGSPLVSYAELGKRWGVSKATAGRILSKFALLEYIKTFSFPGRSGTAIYLQNYLSTMFQISDVMVDKEEVAMALNLCIRVQDCAQDMAQPDCASDCSISVSKSHTEILIAEVLKLLKTQGVCCTTCPRFQYRLYPLSDCVGVLWEHETEDIRLGLMLSCGSTQTRYFELTIQQKGANDDGKE